MDSINIKKLAKQLNVSTSTISRAFRGSSDINKATKERVLSLANELNYEPNHHASNLREKKSKTIAVIVPEIANNFFSQAINGIEKVAREKGYHILIYLTDDDFEKETSFIGNLQGGRVDGIIMSVSGETKNHDYLIKLKKKKIPLVFFDRVYEDIDTAKVTSNDYESSFSATEHLIKSGCQRIAYLVVNKSHSIGKMRMSGYKDALMAHQIEFRDDLIIDCTNDLQVNQEILKKTLLDLRPDGIFASVERLALATYQVCQDLKITIPDELKVISFSSLEIASLLNPSLSTITQPALEMGTAAANLLFKAIESDDNQNINDQIVCKSEIIARRSSSIT